MKNRALFSPLLIQFGTFLAASFAVLYLLRSTSVAMYVSAAVLCVGCALLDFSSARPKKILAWLDQHALALLAAWIALYLLWCGLVLFNNPYRYEFNHGDAAIYTQALWNFSHGLRPESSFYSMNGLSLVGDDPRFVDSYGYVSWFTVHATWLPLTLMTPLYALFSQPPMNVFGMQVWIILLGVPGVYWAARQAGGSRNFALSSAVVYSLLPQVELLVFFKGYFDALALGVMPWLFGAFLGRRWSLMYLFAFLVAAIALPYTHFVIFFGAVVLVFGRAVIPGLLTLLIGVAMLRLDTRIFLSAVAPYYGPGVSLPSFLQQYVLTRTIGSLIQPNLVNLSYVVSLLFAVAFLPLIALRRDGKWNLTLVGLFVLVGLCFAGSMFRSYGWEFQRNTFFIVPVYMMGIAAYTSLVSSQAPSDSSASANRNIPAMLLFSCTIAMIFLGSPYKSGPLASHFPWGENGYVKQTEETRKWNEALAKLREFVPQDASMTWQAEPAVQAFLTSRQHTWVMGREPAEVRYFVFLGAPGSPAEQKLWQSLFDDLRKRPRFKLVYQGVPGKPLVVLENLDARPVPRTESLLGWSVLTGIFTNLNQLAGTAIRKKQ